MIFWILAAALTLASVGWILVAIPRGVDDQDAETDIQVYRAQLADVDRDIERGVMSPEEGDASRVEISRRILAADKTAKSRLRETGGPQTATMGAILAVVIVVGAGVMYLNTGAIGYPDIPHAARIAAADEARANRPDQITIETGLDLPRPTANAEHLSLVNQLRDAVAANPTDARGLELLVRHERALGNYRSAYLAQDQLNTIKGDAVTAEDHVAVADLMILAANGTVSPEAEAALLRALEIEPQNGTAVYYSGLLFAQIGRPDMAYRAWYALERASDPDAPWMPPIRAQIQRVADLAGETYTPPAGTRGPDAADIENAAALTVEERAAMIEGMVNTLSNRIATEGGTPTEWAQLITAHSVRNDMASAIETWQNAKTVFSDAPNALAIIHDAAVNAGLTP